MNDLFEKSKSRNNLNGIHVSHLIEFPVEIKVQDIMALKSRICSQVPGNRPKVILFIKAHVMNPPGICKMRKYLNKQENR